MHELTLFAHVPTSRVHHVERALTTVTGMQGVPLLEHHLVYKPKRNRQSVGGNTAGNGSSGPPNPAGAGDFYYLKLVTEIPQPDDATQYQTATSRHGIGGSDVMDVDSGPDGENKANGNHGKGTAYDVREQRWTIRFSDLPEVNGKRPVTSRMIHNATVYDGDTLAFVDSLGYMLVSEYILAGSYFVYHNIYITLTRTLVPSKPLSPFPKEALQPLDSADANVLQASIKVLSANEQETMNKGVEELKMLRNELKGVADLELGDRLSLDTRVR
ncbi:Mediator of RNA polymerase II transcription subunit 18 [Orbilia ellipsospora]|uniref:Mediator of RNA polymerase II transcription subunit 18 n=1 Tax=Orbilia ellipsospora TaxID=2528407 RepID=A0AAV9WSJ3_9PEZI